MRFPSRQIVESLRKQYPNGTRVELVQMDDAQAPPIGTQGTVTGVDDTGSLRGGCRKKSIRINTTLSAKYDLLLCAFRVIYRHTKRTANH